MLKIRVWDNFCKKKDKYTVAIYCDWADHWTVFSMSNNPDKPDGLNQYLYTLKILPYAKNDILIGNEVDFYGLSHELIKAIVNRI